LNQVEKGFFARFHDPPRLEYGTTAKIFHWLIDGPIIEQY